jgi:hypothetical protein
MKPQDIIKKKPYLAWYVKDPSKLSDEAVLEHVLNYGNWDDVQQYFHLKGLKETARIFTVTAGRQRSNYLPEIQHFFSNYFKHHAS